MIKLLFAVWVFFLAFDSSAQSDTAKKPADIAIKDTDTASDIVDIACIFPAEIEAEFPGGLHAWQQFLKKNLQYPPKAVKKNVEGTVILQFIVSADGTVCDIEAISGPNTLREAAIKALRKTPKWTPAIRNGHYIKSYKKQPIVFRLQ